jgi:hypothetical protein
MIQINKRRCLHINFIEELIPMPADQRLSISNISGHPNGRCGPIAENWLLKIGGGFRTKTIVQRVPAIGRIVPFADIRSIKVKVDYWSTGNAYQFLKQRPNCERSDCIILKEPYLGTKSSLFRYFSTFTCQHDAI